MGLANYCAGVFVKKLVIQCVQCGTQFGIFQWVTFLSKISNTFTPSRLVCWDSNLSTKKLILWRSNYGKPSKQIKTEYHKDSFWIICKPYRIILKVSLITHKWNSSWLCITTLLFYQFTTKTKNYCNLISRLFITWNLFSKQSTDIIQI